MKSKTKLKSRTKRVTYRLVATCRWPKWDRWDYSIAIIADGEQIGDAHGIGPCEFTSEADAMKAGRAFAREAGFELEN